METNELSVSILINRRKSGLTQDKLADSLGLDRITIVRAERNPSMVKPETLRRINEFLSQTIEKNLPQMSHTT